jgi:hypothetical protein
MGKKSAFRTSLNYMTPLGAITRATDSIGRAGRALKHTAVVMSEHLPGQSKPGDYPEGDVRNISDAKERFEVMYEMHEWTSAELAKQIRTLKITKLTAFVMSILALTGVIVLAIVVPIWLAVLLIPLSGVVLLLGMAQGFKFALYEAQIDLREFISAREFVAREDFWQRMLG